MTRSFDNLSVQIRYGMITRNDAIEILKKKGPEVPKRYRNFCKFVEKPEEWFWEI